MQTLVHIRFGCTNVIFYAPRNWVPEIVHYAKYGVAVADRVNDDAERRKVKNLLKAPPGLQLLVDAVEVLGAATYVSSNASLGDVTAQGPKHLGNNCLPVFASRRHARRYIAVG